MIIYTLVCIKNKRCSSGQLDPFMEKSFTSHKVIDIKEKWKTKQYNTAYVSFPILEGEDESERYSISAKIYPLEEQKTKMIDFLFIIYLSLLN